MTNAATPPIVTTIGDRLGFTHGEVTKGQPCTMGDASLILNEKYIGNEGRYITSLVVDADEDGDGPVTVTLSSDSLYDEVEEGLAQTVECRYCDGTPIPFDADDFTVEYE